jgi:hypothetical protein
MLYDNPQLVLTYLDAFRVALAAAGLACVGASREGRGGGGGKRCVGVGRVAAWAARCLPHHPTAAGATHSGPSSLSLCVCVCVCVCVRLAGGPAGGAAASGGQAAAARAAAGAGAGLLPSPAVGAGAAAGGSCGSTSGGDEAVLWDARVYADVARGVLDYLRRGMTHPEGGLYSAEVRWLWWWCCRCWWRGALLALLALLLLSVSAGCWCCGAWLCWCCCSTTPACCAVCCVCPAPTTHTHTRDHTRTHTRPHTTLAGRRLAGPRHQQQAGGCLLRVERR